MKKILILLPIILLSCNPPKYEDTKMKCVITSITSQYKYGGLVPDKSYTIITDCGMKFKVNSTFYKVGDTIDVISRKVK